MNRIPRRWAIVLVFLLLVGLALARHRAGRDAVVGFPPPLEVEAAVPAAVEEPAAPRQERGAVLREKGEALFGSGRR
ncbi:MAG: hypothetical protein HYZ75_09050 [Elusimicrobia bacterium]|nr:hypothetical protein [Elusimicrobiota bacterium]